MKVKIFERKFWLQKKGTPEYEDAYYSMQLSDLYNFSVADGATESSFSDIWSKLLVSAYCKGQLNGRKIQRTLCRIQKKWQEQVIKKPLPWYAAEKLRQGAFSTLLGLTLTGITSKKNQWNAMAVGDSCLFQVRKDKLMIAFPLEHPDQFNNSPYLIASNPAYSVNLQTILCHKTGVWEHGDSFYLMTDALASWFLNDAQLDNKPWKTLELIETSGQFAEVINNLLNTKKLKNDDITLIYVNIR